MEKQKIPSFDDFVDESELVGQSIPEDKVSAGDLLAMGGQGATLGFGDEILGALQAAGEVATTDKELSDILDLYRVHQKENEAKYEALREANPNLALAMELAGGLAIPGAGLARGAKGLSTLAKIGRSSATGAKMGVATGIGTSKSTLGDMKGLATDALLGGAGGATIGGGLTAAGIGIPAGLKYAGGKLKELGPLGENLARAFEASRQGKGFVTPESGKLITEESEKAAKELSEQLLEPSERVTKEIGEYYAGAGEAGIKVTPEKEGELISSLSQFVKNVQSSGLADKKTNIDKKLLGSKKAAITRMVKDGKLTEKEAEALREELVKNPPQKPTALNDLSKILKEKMGVDPEAAPHPLQGLSDDLARLANGELTPQETVNLAKRLSGEFYGGNDSPTGKLLQSLVPPQLKQLLKEEAIKAADKAYPSTTGSKGQQLLEKFKDVRANLPETIMNEGAPLDVSAKTVKGLGGAGGAAIDTAKTKIYGNIVNDIIGELTDPSASKDVARNTIEKLKERITNLNEKYPDLNLNFDEVLQRVKTASQDKTIRSKILTKYGEKDNLGGLTGKLVDWLGYGGATTLGTGTRIAEKGLNNFNRYIVNAGDPALRRVASAMQNTEGFGALGKALDNALDNKSSAAKNAVIFSIMQNPEARKLVSDLNPMDEE